MLSLDAVIDALNEDILLPHRLPPLWGPAGKRTSRTFGGQTTNYTYDYLGRMTQAGNTVYGYDYWGNVTEIGADQYVWDDADRLIGYDGAGTINDTTFGYFPASWQRAKRVKQQTPPLTRLFAWDGADLQGLYDQNGATMWRFETPGLDNHLSGFTNGNTYYFMKDAQGSIRNVADSGQNTQSTYDYRAYGEVLGTYSQTVSSPFRYTGTLYENWHGMPYHMRNRTYMPNVGLFSSRDAMWGEPDLGWMPLGDDSVILTWPQNLFRYCYNSPVNVIDFNGLWPTKGKSVQQASIDRTLPNLPKSDRDLLKKAQVDADYSGDNGSVENSYRHAMRAPGQSREEACKLANDYVRKKLAEAKHRDSNGEHEWAMVSLGEAMHPLQDATSPAHDPFQQWNGLGHPFDARRHGQQEDRDPGANSELDAATRRAYDYFTGATPMPADFFP